MKKEVLLYKQWMENTIGSLHIEFVVTKSPLVQEATFKKIRDKVVMNAFRLQANVFHSIEGKQEFLYEINFGHLSVRNGDIRHIVSRLCEKTLGSMEDLIRIMNQVRAVQQDKIDREAVRLLRKKVGILNLDPFDQKKRQLFVELGILKQPAGKEFDLL